MVKIRETLVVLTVCALCQVAAGAQSAGDEAAGREVIRNYFEGMDDYDADSMKKALSPEAQLFHRTDKSGVYDGSAAQVFDGTRKSREQEEKLGWFPWRW